MSEIAQYIEHTLLKPDSTASEVKQLCAEAVESGFAAVCVPPIFVRDARRALGEESPIRVVTVVGFPMGYTAIASKSEEIKRAIEDGVDEVDAVLNIAAVKSGNWNHVNHDLDSLLRSAQMRGKVLKLIIECGLLTNEEQTEVCKIVKDLGIPFVKTSTGFHGHPTTPEMVSFLRSQLPESIQIKAAGGIRDAATARALLAAGASRLGTSASLSIVAE
ncbi:MAG: deoxyribose-phosphate aldolase [Saprospiraceae bacterium]